MTAKKVSSTAVANALAEARADLDALRDQIGDLRREQTEIGRAPCDREEAARRVGAIIADQAARVDHKLEIEASSFFGPEYREGHVRPGTLSSGFLSFMSENAIAALAKVCPDQLAAALLSHHPGGGLSPDGRAARLTEIERDLQALEVAEEVSTREIEALTGGTIPRRPDATPAILLAPDHELAGEPAPDLADAGVET